jgi:hypothetical protein
MIGLVLINSVMANMIPYVKLPEITIGSDGSISPQTNLISRNGNTYTLAMNAQEYPILIKCSNIIFDGAGYKINITNGDNPGLELRQVSNVTVKNLSVFSKNIYTVTVQYSSNCLITGVQTSNNVRIIGDHNTITKSTISVCIFEGSNNTVVKNNVPDLFVYGFNNNLSLNNFLLDDYASIYYNNIWVGNYWSNYSVKYPNASMIGNSGIGDTAYVIERDSYTTKEYPDAINIDHYPLMCPIDNKNDTITFPYQATTPEPDVQPQTQPFILPIALIIGFCAVSVTAVATCLIYRRKRLNSMSSN